jgi:uncharacterized repeat protein (TIGR03803 family)
MTLRASNKDQPRKYSAFLFALSIPCICGLLSGCGAGVARISPSGAATSQGRVFGGQQPISGARIQLYAVGSGGDGSAATSLIASAVTSSDGSGSLDSNGNPGNLENTLPAGFFTITGLYTCPLSNPLVYIVATGGNPGLAASTSNGAVAEMAALGRCSNLNPSTVINVTEVTTVAAVAALYPYMTNYSAVGSGSSDATALSTAFNTASEYANVTSGVAPGTVPSGYYASTTALNTLANIVAACINSAGGSYNDGSICGSLFYDAKPSSSSTAADTIGALLQILENPSNNVTALFGLESSTPPYLPVLVTSPSAWTLPIVPIPSAPSISPSSGSFSASQPVTLSDTDSSAAIYYTLDGSTPTSASTPYKGPFSLGMTTAVKAIAIDSGAASAIASASLTFTGNFPNVSLTPLTIPQSSTIPATITAMSTANGSTVSFSVSGVSGSFTPATCVIANGTCSVSYVPTGTQGVGSYAGGLSVSFSAINTYSATSTASTLTVNAGVTSATEVPLINFTGMSGSYPGSKPYGQLLLASDGNFYGTTSAGGTNNLGVIYRLTPAGVYTVLHSFSGLDGATPMAGLIEGSDGNFYGTTSSGGSIGNNYVLNGTVFQLTAAGTYTVLHTFQGGTDGTNPKAPLMQATDNNFYGTTTQGYNSAGSGDMFMVSPAGAYSVDTYFDSGRFMLYAGFLQFNSGYIRTVDFAGGGLPDVGLLNTDGSLDTGNPCDGQYAMGELIQGSTSGIYTTVSQGGVNGYGAVCQTYGAESYNPSNQSLSAFDLYSFTGGNDGSTPEAAMVLGSDGNFYGTASAAGAHSQGTAYLVTPAGGFTLLHAFGLSTDGTVPAATLLQGADGNFYGSTQTGGVSGYGMIYKLTPNVALQPPVSLIGPASVTHGTAFTLTYSVANAYSGTVERCFATNTAGDTTVWTGVKVSSPNPASVTLTAPSTAGTYTYSLTCGGTESGFAAVTVQ